MMFKLDYHLPQIVFQGPIDQRPTIEDLIAMMFEAFAGI